MAWPLHIQWKGGWYHITSRENERLLIIQDVEDRREFPGRLSRDATRRALCRSELDTSGRRAYGFRTHIKLKSGVPVAIIFLV
jgi:hypothetical protein